MTDPTPADTQPRDATAALPRFVRRHASPFAILVIGVAVVGFLLGIKDTPPQTPPAPPARSAPDDFPAAVGYAELPAASIKANDRWEGVLSTLYSPRPAPTDPVTRTEEMKLAALADRAKNRAYDTAPPTVPHPIDQANSASCLACHGTGLWVQDKLAPKVSHPHLANCTQCHVEGANPALAKFDAPLTENTFGGVARSGPGSRASPGAPPTIPHTTWMRQDCTSCHGLVARPGLRTTHPWLTSCTQCHAPSAALDQVAFPHPAEGGPP
jgi:cytochrome c-type protein NapB